MSNRKPKAVIYDLDGTLADVSPHLHLVDPRHPEFIAVNLDLFHELAESAQPHQWAIEMANLHWALGWQIVIMTARSERYRAQTTRWLQAHGIRFDSLHMRADDDLSVDTLCKSRTLDQIQVNFDVQIAVDDNPYVLALLKERGIRTIVAPGWPHDPALEEIVAN